MRYALSVLLLAALLPPAPAQVNEAEKLFRDMEKKIQTAQAFQLAVEVDMRDPGAKEARKFKSSLLLTRDNKARLKISGDFGEGGPGSRSELVSDGKQVKMTDGIRTNKKDVRTPKKFHAALSTTVSRGGVWFSLMGLSYMLTEEFDAEDARMEVWDFKAAAAEKIDGRDARVISYRFGTKGDPDSEKFFLWIDSKSLLPLKRVFVMKRDGIRITEVYSEFKLDPKVDARAFELPK
jgi:outer membrane lipoprotein-sorting protein